MCRNAAKAEPHITTLRGLARDHGMRLWIDWGNVLESWARSDGQDVDVEGMRRGVAILRKQGCLLYAPIFETPLAETELNAGEIEAALATVDRTVADTERTGQRWFEAETHRIRGQILVNRDPANAAPAEEAFRTAIAIAQQQRARSFELRAALALTSSINRRAARPMPTPCLRPRLRAFRRPRNFSRSPRRRYCLTHWRKMSGSNRLARLSGPSLAENLGTSQRYLHRLLEATGKTFTEHVND
jgi:AraC-like DNA-binding protein